MNRLTPFTIDDFDLLVRSAVERLYTKADRQDLKMLSGKMVDADLLKNFWDDLDLMGGTE
jgi:hypothetical protein